MTTPRFDVTPFLRQDEGQHFDRKSLFEGSDDAKRPRDRRAVRDQVAEYVAAFANAEGGVLILGIEDGGVVTGHRYPDDAVRAILETPRARCRPPQPEGFIVEHEGTPLLVFDVPASDVPVQVDGDGFPLRMGDRTVQASESQIQALKFRGLAESWEAQPSRMSIADLDTALLERARKDSGLAALSDEEYLLKRKLADHRGGGIALRRAAELLFAIDGPDHPNAGVRVFRVIGTERRVGVEHNVEEKPRIEGNLPFVVASAFTVIEGLIRRPSRLRGIRFQEMPEYPEFSWKESVLNAVAHRDYSVEGRTTEVWFFDDRFEVSSPGGLIPDVTLDELLRLERRHMSRNPRTVRALVDLSIMRDQGEGIPRMFAEMEGFFLPAPNIEARPRELVVTLRNTPTLTDADKAFVGSLGLSEISDVEFRALLEAYRRGRVDNARLRQMTGLETLGASGLLRRLRDRELLTLHAAGPASYYELGPAVRIPARDGLGSGPGDTADRGGLESGEAADRGGFGPDRGGLEAGEPADRRGLTPGLPISEAARRGRPMRSRGGATGEEAQHGPGAQPPCDVRVTSATRGRSGSTTRLSTDWPKFQKKLEDAAASLDAVRRAHRARRA
jgi:ATP-dependent DNA helicase RecG